MSKAWCEKHKVERPQDFKAKEETYAARHTNGTGPYTLKRWDTDVTTVLVAHPGYWGKRGNVTEAHYLVVATAATRLAGLISGEIDIVTDPAVQDIVRLRKQPGIKVAEVTSTGSQFMGFQQARARLCRSMRKRPRAPGPTRTETASFRSPRRRATATS